MNETLAIVREPFFLRALLAGIGIALAAGPIGCFVVWRRMAYFGESLAHAGLLGVAVGLALGIDVTLGVIAAALVMALLLTGLRAQRLVPTDSLLGILSHTALALGLVAASLMTWIRFDLLSLLFGDILTVSWADVAWVWAGAVAVVAIVGFLWRDLLAVTVHEDMARAEGLHAAPVEAAFMVLIAIVVAVAMKISGFLLITALLIIPAAAARRFATSPEAMAGVASLFAALAVAGGLFLSAAWDAPSGPAIVLVASLLFAVSLLVPVAAHALRSR
ncbi:MAG: metal ABC transporter permease [Hyphomicrobiales bacterium]